MKNMKKDKHFYLILIGALALIFGTSVLMIGGINKTLTSGVIAISLMLNIIGVMLINIYATNSLNKKLEDHNEILSRIILKMDLEEKKR